MKKDEAAQFGMKRKQSDALQHWISQQMALVVGADGRGGSGIVIELKDGSFAVLSARHVVVSAASTGELTFVFCGHINVRSSTPHAIRIHPSRDMALLYIRPEHKPKHFVPYSDWVRFPEHDSDDWIVASGAPGLWKDKLNAQRIITKTKILHYFTHTKSAPTTNDCFVCDVNQPDCRLPDRLGGMSGGPVFSNKKQLLGINIAESLNAAQKPDELHVLPLRYSSALFDNSTGVAGPFSDYYVQKEGLAFRAKWRDDPTCRTFVVEVSAQYGYSSTAPEQDQGRIGVIKCIWIEGIPLSLAHRFTYESDEVDQRMQKLKSESVFVLGAISDLIPTG